jgi:HEAT repeat protein
MLYPSIYNDLAAWQISVDILFGTLNPTVTVTMDRPVVKLLVHTLHHGRKPVRIAVAWILGRLGGTDAIEALITALNDADKQVVAAAADALVRIGEPAAISLTKSLHAGSHAITVLERIGKPAVNALIWALDDESELVRMFAISALGSIADVRAIEPLTRSLVFEREYGRALAALALVRIGEPAVGPLMKTLCSYNQQVWTIGANALKFIGEPAVEPLIVALDHHYDQVRILAATVLGWIGDPRAVVPLKAVLDDTAYEVREAAAEALTRLELASAAAIPGMVPG